MPKRMAAAMALLVFSVCLIAGLAVENPFTTTLGRALFAMVGTLGVGLVVGAMAQKMLDDNLETLKRTKGAEQAAPPVGGKDAKPGNAPTRGG